MVLINLLYSVVVFLGLVFSVKSLRLSGPAFVFGRASCQEKGRGGSGGQGEACLELRFSLILKLKVFYLLFMLLIIVFSSAQVPL